MLFFYLEGDLASLEVDYVLHNTSVYVSEFDYFFKGIVADSIFEPWMILSLQEGELASLAAGSVLHTNTSVYVSELAFFFKGIAAE